MLRQGVNSIFVGCQIGSSTNAGLKSNAAPAPKRGPDTSVDLGMVYVSSQRATRLIQLATETLQKEGENMHSNA